MDVVVFLVVWALIGGLIGYAIGNGKGRGTEGFWLGLLLGFIGWIIVAVMIPSEDHEAKRTATIVAAVQAGSAPPATGLTRECPWCAEAIKPAARVCRYCGRDVDPPEPQQTEKAELDYVREEFPDAFGAAFPYFQALPTPPEHPAAWLRELCRRIDTGGPPEAAAARIPLDWSGAGPSMPRPMPAPTGLGDPVAAGDYPAVAREYSVAYDEARALMAGLADPPENPEAWLRELCRRIDAGSPPNAAAARIPLDWQQPGRAE